MNHWTKLSIDLANQSNYLDKLFQVYPTIPEDIRDIDKSLWSQIEHSFHEQDNINLIKTLLKLDLFPIKDSYVAYLRRDKSSIERNPSTVNRLCGRLYEMGLENIFDKATEPKETNRQMGPVFGRWLDKGFLGVTPVSLDQFMSSDENAILSAGDAQLMNFAKNYLNYNHDKGLDFVARFNRKYVIGEAKFLTDFGGHQNAQFNDAIATMNSDSNAEKIAILDGVLYIEGRNKMHKSTIQDYKNGNIMSALVLREYLYQL